jgi:hypothetical protein
LTLDDLPGEHKKIHLPKLKRGRPIKKSKEEKSILNDPPQKQKR